MNKVDIIIPVYNSEKYISYTIDSVLNQTEKSFKLFLVIDPCSDNSLEICRKYSEKDNRVIVIYNDISHGMAGSRDIGYMTGKAEWVSFLDSDDLLAPNFLENLLAITDNETDISQSYVKMIDENTMTFSFTTTELQNNYYYLNGKEAFRDLFLYDKGLIGWQTTWGKIIRRSCIDKFIDRLREKKDIMERTYLDDLSFSPYLWYYNRKVAFFNNELYGFRYWPGSTSNQKVFNKHDLSQIVSLNERISFLSTIEDKDVLYRQVINCFAMVSVYYNVAFKYADSELLEQMKTITRDFIKNNRQYISIKSIRNIHSFLTYIYVVFFSFYPRLASSLLLSAKHKG